MRRHASALFHPRFAAGASRWVRFGNRVVKIPATAAVMLYRWRSPRKPGPMRCDASVPLPGESISLVSAPGVVGQVLA